MQITIHLKRFILQNLFLVFVIKLICGGECGEMCMEKCVHADTIYGSEFNDSEKVRHLVVSQMES